MLKNAATLRQQLRDARFSEIDEIVLGGKGTSPIEAARRIQTDAEMDGWIPGPLQPHVLCPLSNDEVFQLYASQGAISPEEEVQLSVQQPAVEKLVSPADFRLLVQEKDGASKRSQSHRKDLWDNHPGKEHPSTHLQQLHQRVAATALFLGEPQNWLREVLNNDTTNAEPRLGGDVIYFIWVSYSRSTVKFQRVSTFRPFTLAERTTV